VSKKLQCKVPEDLAKVVTALQIEVGTKGKALERLMKAALKDPNEFSGNGSFAGDDKVNCTLTVGDAFYKDETLDYRRKYEITSATAFFRQVLEHGAILRAPDDTGS